MNIDTTTNVDHVNADSTANVDNVSEIDPNPDSSSVENDSMTGVNLSETVQIDICKSQESRISQSETYIVGGTSHSKVSNSASKLSSNILDISRLENFNVPAETEYSGSGSLLDSSVDQLQFFKHTKFDKDKLGTLQQSDEQFGPIYLYLKTGKLPDF